MTKKGEVMALATQASTDGKGITISIDGRFDFGVHKEFRYAYERAPTGVTHYVVDLRATQYMDSSALGMLLLLREHAEKTQANVRIMHCSPEVKKILTIANFHQLFTIV
jgi:anti-anti-sigma factor